MKQKRIIVRSTQDGLLDLEDIDEFSWWQNMRDLQNWRERNLHRTEQGG